MSSKISKDDMKLRRHVFNFVIDVTYYRFDSSVTDESLLDDTRVCRTQL